MTEQGDGPCPFEWCKIDFILSLWWTKSEYKEDQKWLKRCECVCSRSSLSSKQIRDEDAAVKVLVIGKTMHRLSFAVGYISKSKTPPNSWEESRRARRPLGELSSNSTGVAAYGKHLPFRYGSIRTKTRTLNQNNCVRCEFGLTEKRDSYGPARYRIAIPFLMAPRIRNLCSDC